MKSTFLFFSILFFALTSWGQIVPGDVFPNIDFNKNYVINSEAEYNITKGVTSTMSTTSRTSSATEVLSGKWTYVLRPSAAGQTFSVSATALSRGLWGKNCESSFDFNYGSTTAPFTASVLSGATVVATADFVPIGASQTTRLKMPYACPDSVALTTKITSTASSAINLKVDKFYTGIELAQGTNTSSDELIPLGNAEGANPLVGYTTAATVKPTTSGTVGAVSLTATISNVNPLDGTKSFLVSKATGNAQGQQLAIPFSVASGTVGVYDIEIKYRNVSGSFDAGYVSGTTSISPSSLIPYIYDVDNGTWIEPSSYIFTASSTVLIDTFMGSFQTNSNSKNYRLLLHQSNTNTAPYSVQFEFSVKPSHYAYGTQITDWLSIPGGIAITDVNNANVKSASPVTNTAAWRRVGSNLELKFSYYHAGTAGSTGATGAYRFFFPYGWSIDNRQEIAGGGGNSPSGLGMASGDIGGGYWSTFKPNGSPTGTYFELQATEEQNTVKTMVGAGSGAGFNTIFSFGQNNVGITGVVSFPMNGWGASSQQSDRLDNRTLTVAYSTANTTITPANTNVTKIPFTVMGHDPYGAYNPTTGVFTAPREGKYFISANTYADPAGGAWAIAIFKNASTMVGYGSVSYNASKNQSMAFALVDLIAGETLDVRGTLNSGSSNCTFGLSSASRDTLFIQRVGGSSTISATDNISLTYRNNSGQSIANNTLTTITGWTKLDDTHVAFNPTTGIFTAPQAGRYSFSFGITFGDTVAAGDRLVRLKDVTNNLDIIDLYRPYNAGGSGITTQTGSIELPLTSGQQFRIEVHQTSGSAQPISPALQRNFISIKRVGL